MPRHIHILFHSGTSNAPTDCILSCLSAGGSHSWGMGLKLSFWAETSEPRRDLSSLGTIENDSSEATLCSDIVHGRIISRFSVREMRWATRVVLNLLHRESNS